MTRDQMHTVAIGRTAEEDLRRLGAAQRILCDLDGCLVSGNRALPGAVEFTRKHTSRLALVSNNSTDTKGTLATRLSTLGFSLSPDQLFLAGEEALDWTVRRFGPGPVFLLANRTIREAGAARGLGHDDDMPRVVIICRDTDLTMDRLETALRHIGKGLPVILANDDLTHPGECGPAVESGALLALFQACHPVGNLHRIGKPRPDLLLGALKGISPDAAVMIGDNPSTDANAARAANIYPILVGAETGRWLDALL